MNVKGKSIASDLKRLDAMKDEDIDYSDIPPLDESFFDKAVIVLPKPKDRVTLRLDHDIVKYFKGLGRGYQTRMNAVLKAYMKNKKKNKSA